MNKFYKMKYIEIQNSIIKIEDIKEIIKDEEHRQIYIEYNQGNSIVFDYENIKDNINEEKTEVQKDYERIKKELIPKKEDENKIKELENQIEIYKMTLNNISMDVSKYKKNLRNIVNSKEFAHKKIQKLKGVI